MLRAETREFLAGIGFAPAGKLSLWRDALTHGSTGSARNYQRLEFLGDRVLGLAIAEWLYEREDDVSEGRLSQRLNALVSREMCAAIAREIGLSAHIELGAQARSDGGTDSDNILGDVMEALLGASFLTQGYEGTRPIIRKLWNEAIAGSAGQRKHPKSALQEWAAGNNRKMPEYSVIDRSGPDHALHFTVSVSIKGVGEAQGSAASKAEAEKRAAQAFMERFG
ncbi:MAG TPA: ribonuclease III [Sphingomonadaceae bacterium]|nr:ribonuclease III [Sphingomonadaceae bacterium]